MLLGSHLSIAGSMTNALREAESLKLDTVQVFTKNQRQWKFRPLDPAVIADWRGELERLGWEDRTVSHDSYLINLASPDDALWEKSIRLMREEIERCELLSIPYLVSHPGAHVGSGVEAGISRIADAYRRLFRETSGYRTTLCLENTAGGGSTLGRTFEELRDLKALIEGRAGDDARGPAGDRVGFCIDTCHALAAGYDLASTKHGDGTGRKRTIAEAREAADGVLDELDAICGLQHIRVLHFNDSKGSRGSRLDRHQHIGKGNVGVGAFSAFLNRPALVDVPCIMETPKEDNEKGVPMDTINGRRLRRLLDEPAVC